MSEEILGKNDRLEHQHQSVQSEQSLKGGPDILPTPHRSGSTFSSSSLPRAATTPRRVGALLVETYGTVVLRQPPRKHSAPEKVLFEYARFLVGVPACWYSFSLLSGMFAWFRLHWVGKRKARLKRENDDDQTNGDHRRSDLRHETLLCVAGWVGIVRRILAYYGIALALILVITDRDVSTLQTDPVHALTFLTSFPCLLLI